MASDNHQGEKPARITGFRHVFAATRYSLGGLRRLSRETAFWHESLLFLGLILLFAFIGASAHEFVIATILFLLLIATEAFNTAIECIIDEISPEWAEFARDAKDLGSLAVMCVLLANGAFFTLTLWTHLKAAF